jgi:uncharacterized membrane protein YfcA
MALLSIPILVGIYQLNMIEAASASYWILLLGASVAIYSKRSSIRMAWAIKFLVVSIPVLLLTRIWLLPTLPVTVFGVSVNQALTVLFISVVFLVYFQGKRATNNPVEFSNVQFYFKAGAVGLLGGLIGAGGGFLIVPVLNSTKQLKMSEAVATSLAVIFVNASTGIFTSMNIQYQLPWSKLWIFILIATLGALVGSVTSKKWEDKKLKKVFSLILLSVGIGMTLKEIIVSI